MARQIPATDDVPKSTGGVVLLMRVGVRSALIEPNRLLPPLKGTAGDYGRAGGMGDRR